MREAVLADRPARVEEPPPPPLLDLLGTELLGEDAHEAVVSAPADFSPGRELVLGRVERGFGCIEPGVLRDSDRQVQRVRRRRGRLVQPPTREVERVAGAEHEVVARVSVLAERAGVALVLQR